MGKAAREKRRIREHIGNEQLDVPRWAGANGFDMTWALAREFQLKPGEEFSSSELEDEDRKRWLEGKNPKQSLPEIQSMLRTGDIAMRFSNLHIHVLKEFLEGYDKRNPEDDGKTKEAIEKETPESFRSRTERAPMEKACDYLGRDLQKMLERSTPLLFDPLLVPSASVQQVYQLRLPFPVVTCDFLADYGQTLPLGAFGKDRSQWLGLVSATITQPHPECFDVWPVITPMDPGKAVQDVKPVLHGFARIGKTPLLPEASEGMMRVAFDGTVELHSHKPVDMGIRDTETGETIPIEAWTMLFENHRWDIRNREGKGESYEDYKRWMMIWASNCVTCPAVRALEALTLLEAVNVDIDDAAVPRAERRRAQQKHGSFTPAKEVIIRHRQSKREQADSAAFTGSIDWQHRWTVRGHWKHFTRGRVFELNPRKHVMDPIHGECVKIWCPPYVKGPDGMPLMLKSRRVIE